MCLAPPIVRGLGTWNWDGDWIVHRCIVPSSRAVAGRGRVRNYPIDVREFLVTERNEIMRRTLGVDVQAYIARLPGADARLFASRGQGAFDHRADVLAAFVADSVAYARRARNDPWQFPDETLYLRQGDCEDRALLLASLLLASGISPFNVRVALGRMRIRPLEGRRSLRDHVWVMYKNELGRWTVLDPLHEAVPARAPSGEAGAAPEAATAAPPPATVEYVPLYVFNDVHLWRIQDPENPVPPGSANVEAELHERWSDLHPSFIGEVHRTLLDEALTPDVCPPWVLKALDRYYHAAFFGAFGPVVDALDADIRHYDPRDHFDNGYVEEGWRRVDGNLAEFRAHGAAALASFFRAAHGIADFYAHTSWAHFAEWTDGAAALYDPGTEQQVCPAERRRYDASSGFDLDGGGFTANRHLWPASQSRAAAWAGAILSGRYAQPKDTWHAPLDLVIEGLTRIPADLLADPGFRRRGALPHHNEIAVDGPRPESTHRLYTAGDPRDRGSYAAQYGARTGAARAHIRKAFVENWTA